MYDSLTPLSQNWNFFSSLSVFLQHALLIGTCFGGFPPCQRFLQLSSDLVVRLLDGNATPPCIDTHTLLVKELSVHDDKALEFGLLIIREQPLTVSIKERVETTVLFGIKISLVSFHASADRDRIHRFDLHSCNHGFCLYQ